MSQNYFARIHHYKHCMINEKREKKYFVMNMNPIAFTRAKQYQSLRCFCREISEDKLATYTRINQKTNESIGTACMYLGNIFHMPKSSFGHMQKRDRKNRKKVVARSLTTYAGMNRADIVWA